MLKNTFSKQTYDFVRVKDGKCFIIMLWKIAYNMQGSLFFQLASLINGQRTKWYNSWLKDLPAVVWFNSGKTWAKGENLNN